MQSYNPFRGLHLICATPASKKRGGILNESNDYTKVEGRKHTSQRQTQYCRYIRMFSGSSDALQHPKKIGKEVTTGRG